MLKVIAELMVDGVPVQVFSFSALIRVPVNAYPPARLNAKTIPFLSAEPASALFSR